MKGGTTTRISWQIVDPQSGAVLGERVLAHPHDNEQPFTRSLSGVELPAETKAVVVRSACNVHGFGGRAVLVDRSVPESDLYLVKLRME